MLDVMLRPMRESDKPFIYKSWFLSYREVGGRGQRGRVYFEGQRKIIKNALRAGVQVVVWAGDADTILGWICGDEKVVHYVYVKHKFRGLGLAKLLIGDRLSKRCVYTHKTKPILPFARGWEFDPYYLMRSE